MKRDKTKPKQALFPVMGLLFHDARQYLDEQFKPFDLTRPEWRVLGLLRKYKEGVSQIYIKDHMDIEVSYFSKILNRLEIRKFIIREIDPNDRRNRIIKENPKAAKTLQKIFTIINHFNKSIEQGLTEKQRLELYRSLSIIQKNLTGLTGRERGELN
jgi:DNA-binding MarR family transcriptional regulator